MFDYIKGVLEAKTQKQKGCFFTVEANGIGYKIEVTTSDYGKKELNDNIKIYTVLIHREDSMSLCGFLSNEARDIFEVLTSVSGVGVKMALTLLSEFDISDLIYFVINENTKELTKAKGVGTKLAQKIILELKDKFLNFNMKKDNNCLVTKNVATEDVKQILDSLGYEEKEISNAIETVLEHGLTPDNNEEFLRAALQLLSK
jgi:Holliday junction DNA helicase RuvA